MRGNTRRPAGPCAKRSATGGRSRNLRLGAGRAPLSARLDRRSQPPITARDGRGMVYRRAKGDKSLYSAREQHERLRGGERNRSAVQGVAVPCLSPSATPPEHVTVLSAAAPSGANATSADASGTDWGQTPGVGVRERRTPEPPCSKTRRRSKDRDRGFLVIVWG